MLENITIIIKTFERYESLDYLLSSIAKMKLPCHILIADDSQINYKNAIKKKYGNSIDKYLILPYDSGLSKGRNVLVDNVSTKYFLLCDDDFIFDGRTNLNFMVMHLESSDIDILGGMCFNRTLLIQNKDNELIKTLVKLKVRTLKYILLWQMYQNETLRKFVPAFRQETIWDFYGNFEFENDICYISKLADSAYSPPYTRCDYVPNFFMAKTEVLKEKKVFWDEDIKYIGEHLDFFFRAKRNGVQVAITKEVGVIHQRIHNLAHQRGVNDAHIMMEKNNIREFKHVPTIRAACKQY